MRVELSREEAHHILDFIQDHVYSGELETEEQYVALEKFMDTLERQIGES